MDYRQELNINVRQEQRQTISPVMQQALKILQTSTIELLGIINTELQENPALEEEGPSDLDESLEEKLEEIEKMISESDRLDDRSYNVNEEESLEKYDYMMNSVTYSKTLKEHLNWQIRLILSEEIELEIAEYIIYNLNDDGFLQITESEVAERFKVSIERVHSILKEIQGLEPVGVGAKDVREALLIQLRYEGNEDSWAYRIIENHYDSFIRNKYSKIARSLGVDVDVINEAKQVISKLNPYPGHSFTPANVKYVVPDAIVEKVDGKLVITVNDSLLPHLRISPHLKKLVKNASTLSKRELKYIVEKITAASLILKSVADRKNTLYKVTEAIFTVQSDFLEKGLKFLKPLTLAEIAEKVELHESTISRVTNNKYVQTNRGVYELKYFFSSKISGIEQEDLSSKSIKEIIKDLIAREDRTKPLTDEAIRQKLEDLGYKISRRTVTKFREQLNILTSYKRKQWQKD